MSNLKFSCTWIGSIRPFGHPKIWYYFFLILDNFSQINNNNTFVLLFLIKGTLYYFQIF